MERSAAIASEVIGIQVGKSGRAPSPGKPMSASEIIVCRMAVICGEQREGRWARPSGRA